LDSKLKRCIPKLQIKVEQTSFPTMRSFVRSKTRRKLCCNCRRTDAPHRFQDGDQPGSRRDVCWCRSSRRALFADLLKGCCEISRIERKRKHVTRAVAEQRSDQCQRRIVGGSYEWGLDQAAQLVKALDRCGGVRV